MGLDRQFVPQADFEGPPAKVAVADRKLHRSLVSGIHPIDIVPRVVKQQIEHQHVESPVLGNRHFVPLQEGQRVFAAWGAMLAHQPAGVERACRPIAPASVRKSRPE